MSRQSIFTAALCINHRLPVARVHRAIPCIRPIDKSVVHIRAASSAAASVLHQLQISPSNTTTCTCRVGCVSTPATLAQHPQSPSGGRCASAVHAATCRQSAAAWEGCGALRTVTTSNAVVLLNSTYMPSDQGTSPAPPREQAAMHCTLSHGQAMKRTFQYHLGGVHIQQARCVGQN